MSCSLCTGKLHCKKAAHLDLGCPRLLLGKAVSIYALLHLRLHACSEAALGVLRVGGRHRSQHGWLQWWRPRSWLQHLKGTCQVCNHRAA